MCAWKHLEGQRSLSTIGILTAMLFLLPMTSSYAKGVRTTDNSTESQSNRDDKDSKQNDRRSEPPKTDQRSTQSRDVTDQMRRPRPNVPIYQTPAISSNNNKSPEPVHQYYPMQGRTQPQPNPRPSLGEVRRDYSNLGQIWQRRSEYRDNNWNSRQFRHAHYTLPEGQRDSLKPRFFSIPRYRFYKYDYQQGYSVPSAYCLYNGYFPPYVASDRIIIIGRPNINYTYVEIPRMAIDYNYSWPNVSGGYVSPYSSVSMALQDIRRAWEIGDAGLMLKHVPEDNKVDILLDGDYLYSLQWADYRDMTQDAMNAVQTDQFNFYKLQRRSDGEIVAYARHTYRDYETDFDSVTNTSSIVYMSLTLRQQGNDWYITTVNSSPDQL